MDLTEDDELMKRYLFLEKEMAELRKALGDKKAVEATALDGQLNDDLTVVSEEENGEPKSLDVVGMKTLEKDESLNDVGSQAEYRCPHPECVCNFKFKNDLNQHQNIDSHSPVQLEAHFNEEVDSSEATTVIEVAEPEEEDATEIDKEEAENEVEEPEKEDDGAAEIDDDETEIEDADADEDDLMVDGSQTTLTNDDVVSSENQTQNNECDKLMKQKVSQMNDGKISSTKFQCHVCQKCFKSPFHLRTHFTSHTDEKPFACDWAGCGMRFTRISNLRDHTTAIHSNERPFKCTKNDCDKWFKTKNCLYKHLRYTHSSSRQFHCQVEGCGWWFKKKGHLIQHERVHLNHN